MRKPFDASRMASPSAARVGATMRVTCPPLPRTAFQAPATLPPPIVAENLSKAADDGREGTIVVGERMTLAAEVLGESCDIRRLRAAEAVDGLALIGDDPNIGPGVRNGLKQGGARRVHVLKLIDEDVLEAGRGIS